MVHDRSEATKLLRTLGGEERGALNQLTAILYRELQLIARRQLRNEPTPPTIQTSDLVHEAYLRLIDQRSVNWKNRAQFLGLAAQAMRRVLVDRARKRRAGKRGGDRIRVAFDESKEPGDPATDVELIALDDALDQLAKLDRRQSQIVEFRYFGGLSVRETAEVLGVSRATIDRDLRLGKAWLRHQLRSG